jgi:serine protease Do
MVSAVLVVVAGALLAARAFDVEVRFGEEPTPSATDRAGDPFWREVAHAIPAERPDSFAELVEKLSPAVVYIRTEQPAGRERDVFEEFFGRRMPGRPRRPSGTGSGFVISADGYVVTNNHVVENAQKITVVLHDGRELAGDVVGRDPKTDLALLKVKVDGELPTAPLGDSDAIRVGDWVVAIGNPFGLDHTVTVGILSARGRNIDAGPYDDFLQTDASINPGNSGGPLIDTNGRVIGINTAINAAGQGIGFAIPINLAKELLPQLKAHGSVTRGWLGVQIQKVTPELAESIGLPKPGGALVSDVFEDSPAAKAKLQRRDVIVEFDGQPIDNFEDLPRRVAAATPGKDVEIVVLRDGKRKKLEVTLAKMDQEEVKPAAEKPSSASEEWGFQAETLSEALIERFDLDADARGVVVIDVDPDSPAGEAGLQPRDVIVEAGKQAIENVEELEEALEAAGKSALLLVQRGEGTLFLAIKKP